MAIAKAVQHANQEISGPLEFLDDGELAPRILRLCELVARRCDARPELFLASYEDIIEYLLLLIPRKLRIHPAGLLTVETRSTVGTGHTVHLSVLHDDLCRDLTTAAFEKFAHRDPQ